MNGGTKTAEGEEKEGRKGRIEKYALRERERGREARLAPESRFADVRRSHVAPPLSGEGEGEGGGLTTSAKRREKRQ